MTRDNGRTAPDPIWEAPPCFEELYDLYRSAVFSFAYYLTRNRGEAEDLFQEAWLRIIRYLPEKVNMQSLKTWIFTIVTNLHRDNLRKKKVRSVFLLHRHKETEIEAEGDVEEGASGMRDAGFRSDLGRDLDQAINQLPERQRQVFVLKEVSGFKQAEICDILGIPIGTVKSLMYRAVRRLQKELAAYQPQTVIEGVNNAL
ncbi:MAG: RNA polymerase sigma factor [Candidatus Aminicenantaceae bacterium]